MKFLVLVLAVLCMCSCERNVPYQTSDKERISNEIMAKVARKLRKETELIPCGTGGQAMDQIKMLYLGFDLRKPIDIETGRALLITAVQEFASEINADLRIRPYLNNYPFEPKNIQIRIFVQNRDGSDFGQGMLCLISAINGVLEYNAPDLNPKRLKTVYQETYEEALEKIQNTKKEKNSDLNLQADHQ